MSDEEEEFVRTPRRYGVDVFIQHPTMTVEEISAALGMRPHYGHNAGDKKVLPNGDVIKGQWPLTGWRRCYRFETTEPHFADELETAVDRLMPYKAFFDRLQATGGEGEVIVHFLGDGYFGDTLSWNTLANLAHLKLGFGIETYMVPQNQRDLSEI